jgi:hypothetical protein
MYRICLLCFALPLLAAGPPATFSAHTIASDLKGGYQVVVADLNRDGKPDLIALASGMTELVWYENPTWERRVIVSGQSGMINCAVVDAPGGIPDIVLASGFAMQAARSPGKVSVLRHHGDPRDPWTSEEIDQLTTSHRLRTADIDGSGKPVVINAPLIGAKSAAPDYRDVSPIVFYRPGEWKRQPITDEPSGVVHCVYAVDWDGDGREELLVASFGGIHLLKLGRDGHWSRTEIAKGDPSPWPKSGSSDVSVGRLGAARFLAAIEPWHGDQVVIYRQSGKEWARQVIDATLLDGHTLLTADFNGDGMDEVVAGYRGKGTSVYLYSADDKAGEHWSRTALDDGGMGAASCIAADLNGDGRPDIACIDGTRLKWYENLGASKPAPQGK